jgi:hypothetical protein
MLDEVFLNKIAEITRLHDEAFEHYQKFDQHAKISDGSVTVELHFGNVYERREAKGPIKPRISLGLYSYVVAIPREEDYSAPSYYFDDADEALEAMAIWHARAMDFNPTAEEQAELDQFASELIENLLRSGKLKIHNIGEYIGEPETNAETITCNSCESCLDSEGKQDGTYYCDCRRVALQIELGYARVLGYPGDMS